MGRVGSFVFGLLIELLFLEVKKDITLVKPKYLLIHLGLSCLTFLAYLSLFGFLSLGFFVALKSVFIDGFPTLRDKLIFFILMIAWFLGLLFLGFLSRLLYRKIRFMLKIRNNVIG